jgi:hypothetical protein
MAHYYSFNSDYAEAFSNFRYRPRRPNNLREMVR